MCYIHRTTNKSTVLHAYNETTAYTLHSGEYDGNIEMNRRVRYTRYFWKRCQTSNIVSLKSKGQRIYYFLGLREKEINLWNVRVWVNLWPGSNNIFWNSRTRILQLCMLLKHSWSSPIRKGSENQRYSEENFYYYSGVISSLPILFPTKINKHARNHRCYFIVYFQWC